MMVAAIHTALFGANFWCSLNQIKMGNLRWAAAGIVAMLLSAAWLVNWVTT
jgi:hypothetical protein